MNVLLEEIWETNNYMYFNNLIISVVNNLIAKSGYHAQLYLKLRSMA